ncbi:hypothetical protein [Dethiobacter alkaliphilus]|uniref:DUF948 domain-containing protein n=1 Tax=Dethiobacter alkaliphilus AHT 1 TaxID=555088 RepID=C0GIF4_DETAL|nr:hypothetical protein [Dethiobacter alkaliphilus]EEG76815.1 hypothetical protein DealDRAFT_2263 [Dethiobacter alkaliphilus AHT 1]MCW3490983.1 hypothetical protein [Dethiobacter alkaliphilus]
MYVSLQDLGIFLVLLVLFVAGIFLVITLNNINKLVSGINKRISDNEKNIQETITNVNASMKNINEISTAIYMNKDLLEVQVPGTINNLHALSATLKNTGEKVDYSVDMVNTSLVETASTVQENTQDILGYVRIVSESLRIFLEMFSKK